MISAFNTNCKSNCWECPRQCQMKEIMQILDEKEFKKQTLFNVKAQAGMLIARGQLTAQTSKQFVESNFMALVCARQKYLETLNQ